MNNENLLAYFPLLDSEWSVLIKLLLTVLIIVMIAVALYDRFIQRKNQLLVNYPLIGRMRYLFYLLRNPMRQYFGDETFYHSFEKIEWINKVAENKNPYLSFSPTSALLFFKESFNLVRVYSLTSSVSESFESLSSLLCRSAFNITDFDTIAPISKMKTKSNPAIRSAYDIQKLLSAFVLSFLNIFLLFLLF